MPPELDPKPQVQFQRDKLWRNKHRNVQVRAERFYDAWNRLHDGSRPSAEKWKAGLNALRQMVVDAEAQGKQIRAVGGGWSLSEAAACNEFMVNTRPLNIVDVGFGPQSVVSDLDFDPSHLVFAQCGTRILELNRRLERKALALPTSGASNGQTICGAVATGTHGSAVHVGAMQEYVVGLHIVAQGGDHYWVERSSEPVVSDAFVDKLGATLIRDDRLFNAAVVGFGSFGLIHALLLRAEPLYLLEAHKKRYDWRELEPVIGTLDVATLRLPGGAELPFHFEVVLNPYATAAGEKGALVRVLYKKPFTPGAPLPSPGPAPPGEVTSVPGEGLLGFIGTVTEVAPPLIKTTVKVFLERFFAATGRQGTLTPGGMFGGNKTRGKSLSTEIGVRLQDAPEATATVLEVANQYPFVGLVALRYVRGSQALLAFTKFHTTCTIELPSVGSDRSLDFFRRVWSALEERQLPFTLHWGQSNNFNPARVRNMWGAAVDQWLEARRDFLTTQGRATFASDFLTRSGLGGRR